MEPQARLVSYITSSHCIETERKSHRIRLFFRSEGGIPRGPLGFTQAHSEPSLITAAFVNAFLMHCRDPDILLLYTHSKYLSKEKENLPIKPIREFVDSVLSLLFLHISFWPSSCNIISMSSVIASDFQETLQL